MISPQKSNHLHKCLAGNMKLKPEVIRSQPTKCSMENFHILKFLTITQNEIGRKENVEKKQRVFRGNNINLRKLRSPIPKVRSGRIFLPPQFL